MGKHGVVEGLIRHHRPDFEREVEQAEGGVLTALISYSMPYLTLDDF